jgi:hypothetical protein
VAPAAAATAKAIGQNLDFQGISLGSVGGRYLPCD